MNYFNNMIGKLEINKKYHPALSRIFAPEVINSIVETGKSGYLSEICLNSGVFEQLDTKMPLGQFFNWIYNFLFKNYRNEYIYKNAIANKILLGKHSLNTSHMLTEFRAGKCKADAVILNGTSTVYEIKSEYDTFNRLENQINAYFGIFDRINVITSASQVQKLKAVLPEKAGILVLTDRNSIKTIRDAASNKENIKLDILFESLRKSEYLSIIKDYYGIVPDLPNTLIFKECKKLFSAIPREPALNLTIKILRKRRNIKELGNFILETPFSLVAYTMSICNNKRKIQHLHTFFNKSIESILTPAMP